MTTAAAIGIDVGGTKILGTAIDPDGHILARKVVPTPDRDDPLLLAMVGVVQDLQAQAGPAPVGLGIPGMVTVDGMFRYGPNICLREYPLRQRLEEELGAPVVVDNDGNCATWAEFVIGAGQATAGHLVMFTLGTGVGGGIVVGGQLLRGANGFAGEVGHLVVQADGATLTSGVPGELEAYSSGSAMGRMAAHSHAQGRFAGTPLEGPDAPTGHALTAAALEGEPVAREILARAGRYLGIAAAGLASTLDPEMIVVGGGAAQAGELILGPARTAFAEHVLGPVHRPPVPLVAATLGADAGAIGAGLLALA